MSEPEFAELQNYLNAAELLVCHNSVDSGSDIAMYNDSTGAIIGCAMRVHSTLGNGFQEVIYQRAMAIEMKMLSLQFEREKEMPIWYHGEEIGTRRVDFFVDGEIMVELKAIIQLEDVHLAQGLNYLEAYGMKTGLLINFGGRSLEFKRLMNKKLGNCLNRNSSN